MKITILDNLLDCTGCEACSNICPVNCIEMKYDDEGFRYPIIDHNICIKCRKCINVCPVNSKFANSNYEISKFYSVISNNPENLLNSSSGGAFSILAKDILLKSGIVYGCGFDENLRASHIRITDSQDLYKLQGSKYVQSDIGNTFQQCKDDLLKGYNVLYSGTSCQIAGLKKYLGKEYSGLLLVEVLCHGVPSPVLFRKHIERIERTHKGKVLSYEFRSKKKYGWGSENRTRYVINKQNKEKIYTPIFTEYFTAFFYGISLRPACYNCTFSKPKTEGDLILGDFWGYWKKYKKNFNEGISIIAVNNQKGESFINKLKDDFSLFDMVSYENATESNIHFKVPVKRMKQRNDFYSNINKKGYKQIYKEVYFKYSNKKQLLRTFYGRLIPANIRHFVNLILKRHQ